MLKKGFAVLLAALLIMVSFTACKTIGWNKTAEVSAYPATVGNVTIEKKPRSVGSLSPMLTQILVDLGYQDCIVGYSDEDIIPKGVKLSDLTQKIKEAQSISKEKTSESRSVSSNSSNTSEVSVSGKQTSKVESESKNNPSIDIPSDWDGKTPLPTEPKLYGKMGTALEPDMIKIGILKPEVIFTALPFTKAQMDKLDAINIKVMVMPAVKTVEELKKRYIDIISVMDGKAESESAGRETVDEMTRQLDYIISKVPAKKRTFLYVCSSDSLIATGDTFESDVLSLVGDNLAKDKKNYTVTKEQIELLDPDVILYSKPLERVNIEQNELFKNKKAVKQGSIISVDREALLTQTRGIVETVRKIAKQFYPDIDFAEPVNESDVSSEK